MIRHSLSWLRADAPYAPLVQVGLLACLRGADDDASVHWEPDESGFALGCVLRTTKAVEEVGAAVAAAPWPELESLPWPDGFGQSVGAALAPKDSDESVDRVGVWRNLSGPPVSLLEAPQDGRAAAARHVASLLTDGVLNKDGPLGRSRLVGGVKADLSGFKPARLTASGLADELVAGPDWARNGTGTGLGLVPEVQTYGGVTGPKPDSVNESSALLYALTVHALAALPPFGVLRATRRVVGGVLWSDGALTWPIHTTPRGLRALVALYGSLPRHDSGALPTRLRGVAAMYRSRPRPINTTIAMFPWGEQVA